MSNRTILFGTTAPEAVWYFLREQAVYLADQGWEVHVVTSAGSCFGRLDDYFSSESKVQLHGIAMRRGPSPFRDVKALVEWILLLRQVHPSIVVAGTPKAGLLGVLAAWLTRVPVRVYHLRGLRLQTQRRVLRAASWLAELMTCSAATRILSVSQSLGQELIRLRLAKGSKVEVIGFGSSHGVDTHRFRPPSAEERRLARQSFGIPDQGVAVGFAGRISEDKGFPELLEAFTRLRSHQDNLWLVVAGEPETLDTAKRLEYFAAADDHIRVVRWFDEMNQFYWSLDIFCLPSLREGMPNVNLEAAACGLPVVSTTATGCRDSLVNGVTGLLAEPSDPEKLLVALSRLLNDPSLRSGMGIKGRTWVVHHFDERKVQYSLDIWLRELLPKPWAPGSVR